MLNILNVLFLLRRSVTIFPTVLIEVVFSTLLQPGTPPPGTRWEFRANESELMRANTEQ